MPLKNLVVFGDSLSDNGNLYEYMHHQLPKSPPYDRGSFSNGMIWAEYLLNEYFPHQVDQHLLDYAFGGAGVLTTTDEDDVLFTLNREIDTYLLAHADRADPQSMFVVWIGGNNYLGLPDDIEAATTEVQQGIQKGLEKLTQAGAKYITVANLPDLGKTPFAHSLDAEQPFHDISELHNQKLAELMSRLQKMRPEIHWIYFDANQTFTDVFNHPENYPFQNLTDTCYDSLEAPENVKSVLKMVAAVQAAHPVANNPECQRFMFFDLVHPTTKTHRLIADHLHRLFEQYNITFQ